jgi:hypothetical protein
LEVTPQRGAPRLYAPKQHLPRPTAVRPRVQDEATITALLGRLTITLAAAIAREASNDQGSGAFTRLEATPQASLAEAEVACSNHAGRIGLSMLVRVAGGEGPAGVPSAQERQVRVPRRAIEALRWSKHDFSLSDAEPPGETGDCASLAAGCFRGDKA